MLGGDRGYCWSETKHGHIHNSRPFCSDDTFYGHGYRENECDVLEIIITAMPPGRELNSRLKPVTKVVWRGSIFSNPDGPIGTSGSASSNGMGDLFLEIAAWVFNLFGDMFQLGVYSVIADTNTGIYTELTYSRDEIENDSALNEIIDVKDAEDANDFGKQKDAKIIKFANISDEADDKYGNPEIVYTESTKIPSIPVDIYSFFTEKINFFDINFFSISNTNDNAKWNGIKRIILGVTHITLYLSAAALITMLIFRSILFVITTITGNPENAAKSKSIMDIWLKAIVLIIAVFIIMPMIIYLEQYLEEVLLNGNNSRYYIRLNVENVYQFNTNFTGFVKYLSLTSNVGARLGFSILYALISLVDFVWAGVLMVRVLVIAGLTILSPMTAINAMMAKDTSNGLFARVLAFKNWIRLYVDWTYVPLLVLFILKIIISIVV